MNIDSRRIRLPEYKNRVFFINNQLKRKNKYWIKAFLEQYYPDKAGDKSFYNLFINFVHGRSWEAGYSDPGFMEKLEIFYTQTLNQQ